MVQQARNAGVTMKPVDSIPLHDVVIRDGISALPIGDRRDPPPVSREVQLMRKR